MRLLVVTALIAGVLVRIAILPIGVPFVDDSWRAWSYHAATRGPWNLYGPRGHTVKLGDIDAPVVYPPLALDELAIVGCVRLALHGGQFEDNVALTTTYLPFGLRGHGSPELLNTFVPIEPGVVVALMTCAAFGWLAAVLARECAIPDRVPLA
jgi:hypothetical protein